MSFLPETLFEKIKKVHDRKDMEGKLRNVKIYAENPTESESIRYSFSNHMEKIGVQYTNNGQAVLIKLKESEFRKELRERYSGIIQRMMQYSKLKTFPKGGRSIHVKIFPKKSEAMPAYNELLEFSLTLNIH